MPDRAILLIGSVLGRRDVDTARRLVTINTVAGGLATDARHAFECKRETSQSIATSIASKAEGTASQLATSEPERLELLENHITTAADVLAMARRCNFETADLIHPENVRRHLRFPANVMMGELLTVAHGRRDELGELDERLMMNIRKSVRSVGPGLPEAYCQQHAYHLLARYGTAEDRGFVKEVIAQPRDIVTRRTAHYGAIFADNNPDAADRFIFELKHDRNLEQINLDFDFVHYGDKELGESPKRTGQTIANLVRHIQSHRGAGTAEVALSKLISILDSFGLSHFESKRVRQNIEAVLRQIQDTIPERRTSMESEFLVRFGNLALFRSDNATQMSFPHFLGGD